MNVIAFVCDILEQTGEVVVAFPQKHTVGLMFKQVCESTSNSFFTVF